MAGAQGFIPQIPREDVGKELSNQIGNSAFQLKKELGVNFYVVDESFYKFLKSLAAWLGEWNAGSKLQFTHVSIDALKRVNGNRDTYILKVSK